MNEAKAMEEMKRLKGTQTEKNLAAAFAGESQAHVKYTLFARQAEKDSKMSRQIADVLDETAERHPDRKKPGSSLCWRVPGPCKIYAVCPPGGKGQQNEPPDCGHSG